MFATYVRMALVGLLLVLVLAALAGCGGSPPAESQPSREPRGAREEAPAKDPATPEPPQSRPEVVVAGSSSKFDTAMTELYALVLEDAGFAVDREYANEQPAEIAFDQGETDLYVGYDSDPAGSGSDGEARVLEGATNAPMGYALLMEGEATGRYGVSDVSELAADGDLRIAASDDAFDGSEEAMEGFWNVAVGDGEGGSRDVYVGSDEEAIAAMTEGEAEAALAWNMSGEILRDDLVVLEDREDLIDEQSIYLTPVVRASVTEDHPEVEEDLNSLSERLTLEDARALDATVNLDGEPVEDAVKEYYEEELR